MKAAPTIPRHPVEAGAGSTLAPLLLPSKRAVTLLQLLKSPSPGPPETLNTAWALCDASPTQERKK